MSFETMASRLTGWIPKLPKDEAYNMVNDAWTDVRNYRLWSFQLVEDGVASPPIVNSGTVSATLGSASITLDATATTALTGLANPFITSRQFRVQGFSIYNIIGLAGSTLTLDRPFIDPVPVSSSLAYQVYQAYYPAPFKDFKRWIDWRDMVNGRWLTIYTTRRMIDIADPQRLYYNFPFYVLPFQTDQRTGTSTPGWMLYELYPNPLSAISYMRWGVRTGADLVNPADTLPNPITDKLVLARARMLAYTWAEANKDPSMARGAGSDYNFLTKEAAAEYTAELKWLGNADRDRVDLFLSRIPERVKDGYLAVKMPYYNSVVGRAYAGY